MASPLTIVNVVTADSVPLDLGALIVIAAACNIPALD
jgi:hypothetical protein